LGLKKPVLPRSKGICTKIERNLKALDFIFFKVLVKEIIKRFLLIASMKIDRMTIFATNEFKPLNKGRNSRGYS
tara:strand:+ start:265 stop:486 length:222 start_codon:yes stop_codon:yes gene_type:complete